MGGVQLYERKETPTKLTIHAKWVSEEAEKNTCHGEWKQVH